MTGHPIDAALGIRRDDIATARRARAAIRLVHYIARRNARIAGYVASHALGYATAHIVHDDPDIDLCIHVTILAYPTPQHAKANWN